MLKVNGRDQSGTDFNLTENVYIDAEVRASGAFSIVELFHEPGKPNERDEPLGDFRLYDQVGESFAIRDWAREPEGEGGFRIDLLNRHTFWRYHFPGPETATELGDLEPINSDDSKSVFVTKRVMPLTRGVTRVEFTGGTLLPNPPSGPVVPEADRVYSDIYVRTK